MSFLYLAGAAYNQIARAVAQPVPGSSDSILGDVDALSDYETWQPFLFAGTAGTSYIDFTLKQTVNGSFETAFSGGLPGTGWGKSSGATITRENFAATGEGSYCLRVAGADEHAYFDLEAAAGETLTGAVYVTTDLDAGAGAGRVKVQNLATGKWLTSAGTWQTAETSWASGVDETAWTYTRSVFTVEDYTACQADTVTLRFYFVNEDPSLWSQFDGFYVWPRINFVALIGHNIPPGCTVRLWSANPGPNTVKATLTVAQPTMWSSFSSVDDYAFRLSISDPADLRQIFLREVVLGQYRTLAQQRQDGAETVLLEPQDRDESTLGPGGAFLHAARGRRRMTLPLKHPSSVEAGEWQEMMERSRNGALPLLIVPDSARSDSAMLCMAAPEYSTTHLRGTFTTGTVQVDELPFPALVS